MSFYYSSVSSISPSPYPWKKVCTEHTSLSPALLHLVRLFIRQDNVPGPSVENPSHMLVPPQLYCSLLIFHHLSCASIIPPPHNTGILGISPGRPIFCRQDSLRPRRQEPSRYPPVDIPLWSPPSFDGVSDGRPYITGPALVHQRVAVSVSVDLVLDEEGMGPANLSHRLSDITAIWNTNAFFAYIIAVRLFKLNWEPRKLLAVLIATFGVMAVVYGDVGQAESPHTDQSEAFVNTSETVKPKSPVLGDILTLFASVGYGLYQVMYKRYAALLQDGESELSAPYIPLPDSDGPSAGELDESVKEVDDDLAYPPPFGLYPNLLTGIIGLMTLSSLWVVLPILHYSAYERFRLPDNPTLVLSIAGIAASGLVFVAGLLVPIFFIIIVLYSSLVVSALLDFIGRLGTHRCLCRQPPHDRSRSPIRHDGRARHRCYYALELSRLRWDHSSIRHLGL